MDVIFNKVLKNKIIKLVKFYGGSVNELVLYFPLSIGDYHTIEWDDVSNDLTLHMFDVDYDYPLPFDDLSEQDKLRVYQILKGI